MVQPSLQSPPPLMGVGSNSILYKCVLDKEAKALLLLFLEAENPRLINVINPMQDGDINSNTYVLAN